MATFVPMEVGKQYRTKAGKLVTLVSRKGDGSGPYDCVEGDDGLWRYNRPQDQGRVTASAFDMSDPENLIPTAC